MPQPSPAAPPASISTTKLGKTSSPPTNNTRFTRPNSTWRTSGWIMWTPFRAIPQTTSSSAPSATPVMVCPPAAAPFRWFRFMTPWTSARTPASAVSTLPQRQIPSPCPRRASAGSSRTSISTSSPSRWTRINTTPAPSSRTVRNAFQKAFRSTTVPTPSPSTLPMPSPSNTWRS